MRDLYLWSQEKVDLTAVREAKAAMAVDYKVRPVAVSELADLPELDSRVLAIGTRPPFLCDYALVTERTSPEGYVRALRWVLGEVADDPKATTILDTMTSVFGPGTREIPQEELDGNQRLRDYQQNRV